MDLSNQEILDDKILARAVHDYDYDTGCGDTCDLELDLAVRSCNEEMLPDADAYVACVFIFSNFLLVFTLFASIVKILTDLPRSGGYKA